MKKRKYTHVQELLPEIRTMVASGKTQREIAEHYGLRDKYVIKELLKRERRKQEKLAAGIAPKPRGQKRKEGDPRDIIAEQNYEISRLKRENELLRDFLQSGGRR